ncbi:MAG TPA: lytic transglycosylase domain-containing protein [Bacteroidales bacterium]|nr:lytic transglycosylase domain-containing protein [Bacteroidales bacterium]
MNILNRKAAVVIIITMFVAGAGLVAILGFSNLSPAVSGKPTGTGNPSYVYKLPDSMFFAGERMPLENIDTRESLEREIITTAYRHSSTILIIKKSHRFFPLIEKILAQNGIPDDFKYLVAAESDMLNQVSPAGATGFWQIMAETGKEQGLEINNEVDERYNLEKATKFACDFFRKSYDRYGNWTLAAASYDGGRNAIDEQISIQREKNYYDLLLADETARYIFRVVAYKIIMNDPAAYGFELTEKDYYPELKFTEIRIDSGVSDFTSFARSFGTNYKNLKMMNPWLRKPYLTNRSRKSYLIKIPEKGSRGTGFYENNK